MKQTLHIEWLLSDVIVKKKKKTRPMFIDAKEQLSERKHWTLF